MKIKKKKDEIVLNVFKLRDEVGNSVFKNGDVSLGLFTGRCWCILNSDLVLLDRT